MTATLAVLAGVTVLAYKPASKSQHGTLMAIWATSLFALIVLVGHSDCPAHAATREPVRVDTTRPFRFGRDSIQISGTDTVAWFPSKLNPTRKVVMPHSPATGSKPVASGRNVAPGSSQSVAAAPVVKMEGGAPSRDSSPDGRATAIRSMAMKTRVSGQPVRNGAEMVGPPLVLRYTLPAYQQGQPCADGAPLAWLDSVRVMARRRGPTGPYNSAAWVAYLALPDSLVAQHAVSWTRIGQADSFTVAPGDTGATGWVQVRGTRGWSGVCRWVGVWR